MLGAILPLIMKAAPMLSGLFGGASKKAQENNDKQDSLKLALEGAKLNRDKFAEAAPGQRLATSTKASLTSNFQPTKVDWGEGGFKPGMGAQGKVPTFSGGFAGGMANLNPETKQLSEQVMHDSLVSQMRGGETGGGTGVGSPYARQDGVGTDRAMPQLSGGGSKTDKLMGGMGMGFSILDIIRRLKGGGNDGDQMEQGGGG